MAYHNPFRRLIAETTISLRNLTRAPTVVLWVCIYNSYRPQYVNSLRPTDAYMRQWIGSDNGLSPGRCQAIIWPNAGILLIGPFGTNLSEMLIEIQTFSIRKMHSKMPSAKWQPFCLGLGVIKNSYLWCKNRWRRRRHPHIHTLWLYAWSWKLPVLASNHTTTSIWIWPWSNKDTRLWLRALIHRSWPDMFDGSVAQLWQRCEFVVS